jgi:enoyl-CoA hydratase
VLAQRRVGGALVIELDRPPANALSNGLIDALLAALCRATSDAGVRSIVLTGAGERFFCAGGDLKELAVARQSQVARRIASFHQVLITLDGLGKPVVTAANGHAVGGGFELCVFSDAVVSVRDALFGYPEIAHGVLPIAKGVQRTVRCLGLRAARRLLLTGEPIGAQQAADLGVVEAIVPRAELLSRSLDLAGALAAHDPSLFAGAKALLESSWSTSDDEELLQRSLADLERFSRFNRVAGSVRPAVNE